MIGRIANRRVVYDRQQDERENKEVERRDFVLFRVKNNPPGALDVLAIFCHTLFR